MGSNPIRSISVMSLLLVLDIGMYMMKLTKEEFQRVDAASPMELFYQGIKAEETRDKYTRTLRHVLCGILEEILDGDFEERVEQFVKYGRENPEWMRDLMLSISKKLRRRTQLSRDHPDYFNPVSFGNYFKPVKKLLEMNDVVISWKRVYATFPELDNVSDSRGWERNEIQRMLHFAKGTMDRAIILLAASSGIRAGGFDLRWDDLIPIYRNGDGLGFEGETLACAMIRVYRGTSAEYPGFITPEAYRALQNHRGAWTVEVGREPEGTDPIFKKEGPLPKKATLISIRKRMDRMIRGAGLRAEQRKTRRRFEVPMMNGFRRFWNKACKESLSKESPLSSLIKKEYMMGHSGLVSLDRNYFKTHTMELAEEYLCAVPNLTIDDSIRLAESNRRKSAQIAEIEIDMDRKMEKMRGIVESLADRIDEAEKRKR